MAKIAANANLRLRGKFFRMLGSFWSQVFKARDQARVLSSLAIYDGVRGRREALMADITGDDEEARREFNLTISFAPEDIFPTGQLLYDDSDFPVKYAASLGDSLRNYGAFRIPYFAWELQDVIPIVIQAPERRWLCGTDFFVVCDRWVLFREDPRKFFADGKLIISLGRRRTRRNVLGALFGADGGENSDFVVTYFKALPTPEYFRLALAAVGGLGILRKGGRLLARHVLFERTIYTFEQEVIRVDYRHAPLEIGNVYPQHYIIGSGVQVFQSGEKPTAWWRKVNWKKGLSLRPILPVAGHLNLVDEDTVAYPVGQDRGSVSGSKTHARLKLAPDYESERPYWEWLADRETKTGQYLNSLLGLDQDAGQFKALMDANAQANALNQKLGWPLEQPDLASLPSARVANPLDVFFQALLDRTAYVVVLDLNALHRVKEMFGFLAKELPAGGTPVVFAHGPDLAQSTGLRSSTGAPLPPLFYSFPLTQTVSCPDGTEGSPIVVSVPVGAFTSTASQASANIQAEARLAQLVALAEDNIVCDEPCTPQVINGSVNCFSTGLTVDSSEISVDTSAITVDIEGSVVCDCDSFIETLTLVEDESS